MNPSTFYAGTSSPLAVCGMSGPEIEWEEYDYALTCGARVHVLREIVYLPAESAEA